jgi:hypothetical protein
LIDHCGPPNICFAGESLSSSILNNFFIPTLAHPDTLACKSNHAAPRMYRTGMENGVAAGIESEKVKEEAYKMRKTRIWLIVLLTIVAVAALAAGGYGIYRLGYAHAAAGATGAEAGKWMGAWPGHRSLPNLPQDFPRESGEGFAPFFRRGALPMWGMHQRFGAFPILGGLFGLLLGGGILALAVYGIISLVRQSRSAKVVEEKPKPARKS